jgi:mxaJ protein
MCSGSKVLWLACWFALAAMGAELRVCSDPNNLPFSNDRQQGFENQIANLVAHDLGRTVTYVWWPSSRSNFYQKTIDAHRCDIVIGVPARFGKLQATNPYYRSTYVFVSRRDRGLHIQSLNDPELRRLRIGVHVVSDDSSNLPPAQALANRGLFANMVTFNMYSDYSKPNPPAALIDAVANKQVDLGIAWGPLAGYFAKHSAVPLELEPVTPMVDRPFLPFTYEISMGVRLEDKALLKSLNAIIVRDHARIHRILENYGVPLLDWGAQAAKR